MEKLLLHNKLQGLTEVHLVLTWTLFDAQVCRQTGTLFTVGKLIKSFSNNNIEPGVLPYMAYLGMWVPKRVGF